MAEIIDNIDKKLINMLISNSRTSYADMAKEVDLSSPSVIERIKKLEANGIIKSYTANVNYKALGYDILAFIGISLDSAQSISEFETNISNIDEDLIECHHVTGDFTMIAKVITKNTDTLSNLIKKIRNIKGVQKTNTILVFSTIMDRKKPV
ncbi:Lrp/AsnC family transcriptional regulator [Calditerrivibrio nitroreducens]|uniref:Transcriptional regulator, AsnC family n=1 Tax=Calditerrivibrio nitroreducens (strain DSM 19672 / NBRC 101217 / Yu37-1) TaxID=768670 RepID=E4TFR6_CALNY|nr:Lrp/AsnC family transcriptional regulator [Calditerrivibrio nitroreducens]ADR18534.1 transcriptional regulator, AsnC family [Calditerrivibrio nitroreducens DSM 19672]